MNTAVRPSGLYVLALEADAVPHFVLSWHDMTGQQWYLLLDEERIPAHFDHAPEGRGMYHAAVCGVLLAQGEKADPPTPLQMDMIARVDGLLEVTQSSLS